MQLEFGYGNGVQTVELPQENLLSVLHAAPILVGRECYETVRCVDSDAADCIHLGDTAHGTPVDITRAVAEADFRICLGNIEFHYFAGYSGGAPKDANLYQTQKALDNAKHAVKDGGTIILIGACPEGLGSKTFSDWLLAAPTAHSMVERISRNFQLGGHKAAAIAMVLEKASIDLISEMDDDFVRRIFLEPKPSAQAALDAAFRKYGPCRRRRGQQTEGSAKAHPIADRAHQDGINDPPDAAARAHDACCARTGFREQPGRLRNERRPDRAVGEACRKATHERYHWISGHGQRQQECRACKKAADERLLRVAQNGAEQHPGHGHADPVRRDRGSCEIARRQTHGEQALGKVADAVFQPDIQQDREKQQPERARGEKVRPRRCFLLRDGLPLREHREQEQQRQQRIGCRADQKRQPPARMAAFLHPLHQKRTDHSAEREHGLRQVDIARALLRVQLR